MCGIRTRLVGDDEIVATFVDGIWKIMKLAISTSSSADGLEAVQVVVRPTPFRCAATRSPVAR